MLRVAFAGNGNGERGDGLERGEKRGGAIVTLFGKERTWALHKSQRVAFLFCFRFGVEIPYSGRLVIDLPACDRKQTVRVA